MKLKLAYMALKAADAADAAMDMALKAIIEISLLLVGWLLLGGEAIVCLWAFMAMAAASLVAVAIFVFAMAAIRALGYTEVQLERWGLE